MYTYMKNNSKTFESALKKQRLKRLSGSLYVYICVCIYMYVMPFPYVEFEIITK